MALKALLVVLALMLPQVLALALGLYHLSWFLGVQALASPLSSVIRRCVFLTQRLPTVQRTCNRGVSCRLHRSSEQGHP